MELLEYLKAVPFPEKIFVSESGVRIGRLNQYRELLRMAAVVYNKDIDAPIPKDKSEAAIEQLVREKYRDLYDVSWDIIGDTSAQEIIDAEDRAENEEKSDDDNELFPAPERGDLRFVNDGKKIVNTTYWDSAYCLAGKVFLSINAGAFRLLLPKSMENMLKEIEAAYSVVISRGPWPSEGKTDALELLFEDGSDNPYCIHISAEQVDRLPPGSEQGWKGVFHIYANRATSPVVEFQRVYYRRVEKIPCLKPAPEPQ
jgi:hypothetical protein